MKTNTVSYITLFYMLASVQVLMGQLSPNGQTVPTVTTQTLLTPPAAYNSGIKYSSVRTWIPSRPFYFPENIWSDNQSTEDVKLETQYLDGLGRPLQTVTRGTSGMGKDIVSPYIHDNMGRMQNEYLSYASDSVNGRFRLNPFNEQNTFFKSIYNPTNNTNGEKFFYGQIKYETTPIGRVSKSLPPGNSWVGTNRGMSRSYEINAANEVRIWSITDVEGAVPTSSGFYTQGQLSRDVFTDEEGKMNIEYKDKQEKVILRKVQLTSINKVEHPGWLCTYYVYDRFSNLRCVIPPKAIDAVSVASWSFTSIPAAFKDLCYWYWYDAKGRVKVKKEPGKGTDKMVYDALDRLVMTQDSTQTIQGTWLVNQYDIWNRVVATYQWTNSQTRAVHEAAAASSISYPVLSGTYDLLTQQYYDNYTWVTSSGSGLPTTISAAEFTGDFYQASNVTAPYARAITPDYNVKGLQTGSKIKVLGTAVYLFNIVFYDSKGNQLQVQQKNITGGIDIMTSQFSFDGKLLVKRENRNATGMTPANVVLVTKYEYDPVGRLTGIKKKVNSNPEIFIARNSYNELGELKAKQLGQKKTDNNYSTDAVEAISYTYNVRGWLTGINQSYISNANSGNSFGMELSYDYGYNVPSNGYYTGNIAGSKWRSAGDGELRSYGYGYDATRRLLKADFTQYSGAWNNSAGIDYSMKVGDGTTASTAYDANGNMLSMYQKGWKPGGSVVIDSLLHTYQDNSNFLKNVIDKRNDTATRLGDFRSSKLYMTALSNVKANSAVDYTYDGNGNMSRDRNKDIGDGTNNGIIYNYLNLPQTITFRGTGGAVRGTVTFNHDAEGTKIRKTVQESGFSPKTTLYINGLVYQNDTLQFISHEEGRIRYIPEIGGVPASFQYDYFIKDNLGSTRSILSETTSNDAYPQLTLEGTGGTAEVQQQDNYWENSNGQSVSIATSRIARPGAFGTATTNGNYAYLVRKSTGAIGATKLLKVMAGDRIHTSVEYYYTSVNANNSPANGISSFIASLATSLITAGNVPSLIKGQTGAITTGLQNNTSLVNALNTTPNTSGANQAPKAYLNILFFDERFNYDNVNSQVIPVAYIVNQKGTIDKRLANSLLTKKSGYVYLYFSNESDEMVYFDNFMLTHERGRLLEESHYYPYGLQMAGISSKAFGLRGNQYLFNGKELQSRELSNGDGLEWNDYGARMLDHQIGRWHTLDPKSEKYAPWSPYSFVANNPALLQDPDGKEWVIQLFRGADGNLFLLFSFTGVILNSSGKSYDALAFEQRIRAQIQRVFNTKVYNSDGKSTTTASIVVNIRTVKSENEIKDSDHIIEIVNPNQQGIFVGNNSNAWARAPLGGLRVYINYNHLNEIISGRDPNSVPHELGHTAGLLHPEDAPDSYGWQASRQELSTFNQDNKRNLMWSSYKLFGFRVPLNTAISLNSVQLGLMNEFYHKGKLNQKINFGRAPWLPERRILLYPKN